MAQPLGVAKQIVWPPPPRRRAPRRAPARQVEPNNPDQPEAGRDSDELPLQGRDILPHAPLDEEGGSSTDASAADDAESQENDEEVYGELEGLLARALEDWEAQVPADARQGAEEQGLEPGGSVADLDLQPQILEVVPAAEGVGLPGAGEDAVPGPLANHEKLPAPAAEPAPRIAGMGAPKARPKAGQRAAAEVTAVVPGGRVTWYRQGFFTAQCDNEAHGRCVLTRSSFEGRSAPQGRPLSLLTAWLSWGQGLATKEEHWQKQHWPGVETSRSTARCWSILKVALVCWSMRGPSGLVKEMNQISCPEVGASLFSLTSGCFAGRWGGSVRPGCFGPCCL